MHAQIPVGVQRKIRLAVGAPVAVALCSFYAAQVADTGQAAGMAFMVGLTAVVIAAVWGPYLHWAWRTRHVEELHEDEVADLRYTIRRNRADIDAQTLVIEHLRRQHQPAVGWIPDGPTPPRPPAQVLQFVRRDEG